MDSKLWRGLFWGLVFVSPFWAAVIYLIFKLR